ncbi:MAG: hypothetical protein IKN79_08440, partial [Eubacterium sp.]|nr:hypothetical protein [Eubacterium sp.]
MRYKCMICGGSIAGDNNKFCPYCGSESICQIENDSDVFQEGEVFTVFSEERKKEPNNINEQEKNSEKDEWSSDNRLENEKSEKKTKNRMVWTIAIIATVIIAIIGTLVFVSNREKNIEDGLGKESEKNNTNAGKGTFILEVKSSFTGDIKRWSLVEGTELTARTGSTFYLKREMEDKNVVSDGFSIMADDMELISIEGNAITVNNNNNYKKVQITVSVAGGEDLHFVMNVKKGGWNKEGNNHYYIDETDTRLTGWIQVIEDGNDHA